MLVTQSLAIHSTQCCPVAADPTRCSAAQPHYSFKQEQINNALMLRNCNDNDFVNGDEDNETVAMQPSLRKNEAKLVIEQLILHETFSWDECIELTKIIESRVVDSPTNGAKDAKQKELHSWPFKREYASPGAWKSTAQAGNSSKPFPYSASILGSHSYSAYAAQAQSPDIRDIAIMKARKWIEEKRMDPSSKSNVELESNEPRRSTLPYVSGSERSSPVDVAKSYMRGQTPWSSPFNIRSNIKLTNILQADGSPSLTSSKSLKRSSLAIGSWDSANESRRVRLKLNDNFHEPPGGRQIDSSAKSMERETFQSTSVTDKREMVSITHDSKSSPTVGSTDAAGVSCSFHLKQNSDMLEPPAAIQIDSSLKTTQHETVQSTSAADKREVFSRQTDSSAKSMEQEIVQETSVADKRDMISIAHDSKSSLTVESTDALGGRCSFSLKQNNDTLEPPAARQMDFSAKTAEHETFQSMSVADKRKVFSKQTGSSAMPMEYETVQSTTVADKEEACSRQTDSSAKSMEHEIVQETSVADKREMISIAKDSKSSPTVESTDAPGGSCSFSLKQNNDMLEPHAVRQMDSSAKTTGHKTVQNTSVADKREVFSINHDSNALPPVKSSAALLAELFETQDEDTPSDGKLVDNVVVLENPSPVGNTSDSKLHIIALEEAKPSDAAVERDSHTTDVDDLSETNASDSRSQGGDDSQMQSKPASKSDARDYVPLSSPAQLNEDQSTNEVIELGKADQTSIGYPTSISGEDCELSIDASLEVPATDEANNSADEVRNGSGGEQEKAPLVRRSGRQRKSSNRAVKKTTISKHQSPLRSSNNQELEPISDGQPNHKGQPGSASIRTGESNSGAVRRGTASSYARRGRVRGK